jgi:hypothetical protein
MISTAFVSIDCDQLSRVTGGDGPNAKDFVDGAGRVLHTMGEGAKEGAAVGAQVGSVVGTRVAGAKGTLAGAATGATIGGVLGGAAGLGVGLAQEHMRATGHQV